MKEALKGYQCESCRSIYKSETDAKKCEETPLETPLMEIGDILIDDSYGKESVMRVCRIACQ